MRSLFLVFLLIPVTLLQAQDPADLRNKVLESALAGWEESRKLFEQDGVWMVTWKDGMDLQIELGRLNGNMLVTDTRIRRPMFTDLIFDGPADKRKSRKAKVQTLVTKLIETESGWKTLEKKTDDETWTRRNDEPADSKNAARRIFQATVWQSAPFALTGVSLKSIFEHADTFVHAFDPVPDRPGIHRIEFSMNGGLPSDIPGASILDDKGPFVFYPAKCTLFVDSDRNWRIVSADYQREGTRNGTLFDHTSIEYTSDNEFVVIIGQGGSAESAKEEKKRLSISFAKEPPEENEFELETYPLPPTASPPDSSKDGDKEKDKDK